MERRPWKDRLVRNCDGISEKLIAQFERETGQSARQFPLVFLDWVGLKPSPTALKRVRSPLIKNAVAH